MGCSGEMTSSSEMIASIDEDSDGFYDGLLDCLWTVRLNTDKVITFEFREMDIHMRSSACSEDYIEVRIMIL